MRQNVFLFAVVCLSGCIGGVSSQDSEADEFFQQRKKSMDVIELIALLCERDHRLGDWQALSNDRRFDWANLRTKKLPGVLRRTFCEGGVDLHYPEGAFIRFNSAKHQDPTPWSITLEGGRAGYSKIILDSHLSSEAFTGFRAYFNKRRWSFAKRYWPVTRLMLVVIYTSCSSVLTAE